MDGVYNSMDNEGKGEPQGVQQGRGLGIVTEFAKIGYDHDRCVASRLLIVAATVCLGRT